MDGDIDPIENQAARVVRGIEEMLAAGTLVPGQRLVEADLMAQLNVGRLPVREGLRILAGDGIVQLSRGRGARVRALTPERLLAMMQFIGVVTGFAVASVIDRGIDEALAAELKAAAVAIVVAIDAGIPIRIIEKMSDFLDIVVANAGNEYAAEVWARMHMPHYRRHLYEHVPTRDIVAAARKFEAFTAALLAGNRARAIALDRDIAIPFYERAQALVDQQLAAAAA